MNNYAEIAETIRARLAPYCERIAIAGSIRRGKPDPHDIELVCAPKLTTLKVQVDMFSEEEQQRVNVLDGYVGALRADGQVVDRRDKNGRAAWGERFKRLLWVTDGGEQVALDLFSVIKPAEWGVIFAIRTGPAEFSKLLVTARLYQRVGLE